MTARAESSVSATARQHGRAAATPFPRAAVGAEVVRVESNFRRSQVVATSAARTPGVVVVVVIVVVGSRKRGGGGG